MTRAATFYRHRDFTVAAPGGDFEFLRTFTSDPTKWTYWTPSMYPMLAGVPVPFGNAPSGNPTAIGGPMRWVHNLFSVVYVTPVGDFSPSAGIYVRDMGGGLAQFAPCLSYCWGLAGGWAKPHPQAPATYGRLRVINGSSGNPTGYEYTQPNGVVLILDKQYGSTNYYFLRKALNAARQTWFEIVYYESPAVVPNCPTLSPTGVPYIKEVRLDPAGGSTPALQFNYSEVVNITPAKACLLTSVAYRSPAGTDTNLASYGYHQDGGVASLASVHLPDGTASETYDYGLADNWFRRERGGAFVSQHDLGVLGSHGFSVTSAHTAGKYGPTFGGSYYAAPPTPTGVTPPPLSGMPSMTTLTQTYASANQVGACGTS